MWAIVKRRWSDGRGVWEMLVVEWRHENQNLHASEIAIFDAGTFDEAKALLNVMGKEPYLIKGV